MDNYYLKRHKAFIKIVSLTILSAFLWSNICYCEPEKGLRLPLGFQENLSGGGYRDFFNGTKDASRQVIGQQVLKEQCTLSDKILLFMVAKTIEACLAENPELNAAERAFSNRNFRKQISSPIEIYRNPVTGSIYISYKDQFVYLNINNGDITWTTRNSFEDEITKVMVIYPEEERQLFARRYRGVIKNKNTAQNYGNESERPVEKSPAAPNEDRKNNLANLSEILHLKEPLSQEITKEIFDRMKLLSERKISEASVAEFVDLLYRLYRGYPFTGNIVLKYRDRVISTYRQSIEEMLDFYKKLQMTIEQDYDNFETQERVKIVNMMEMIYSYEVYFSECLAGVRNLASISELVDEVVGKFKNNSTGLKKFWNAAGSFTEKLVRPIYGWSGGVKKCTNILTKHALAVSGLGNQICKWQDMEHCANYPELTKDMSNDEILKQLGLEGITNKVVAFDDECSMKAMKKSYSMLGGRLYKLITMGVPIVMLSGFFIFGGNAVSPENILKAFGLSALISIIPQRIQIWWGLGGDEGRYRRDIKRMEKSRQDLHKIFQEKWGIEVSNGLTVPGRTAKIFAEELNLSGVMRKEMEKKSADLVVVITDKDKTGGWEKKLQDTRRCLVRKDTDFIVLPQSHPGSGMALLDLYEYLEKKYGKEYVTEKRIIVLLAGGNSQGAMEQKLVNAVLGQLDRDPMNIEYQLAVGYKAAQALKKQNKGGRIIINADGRWTGPVRVPEIEDGIVNCGYFETGRKLEDRKALVLVTSPDGRIRQAYERLSFEGLKELLSSRTIGEHEAYNFEDIDARQFRVSSGVWIETVSDKKLENLINLFAAIKKYIRKKYSTDENMGFTLSATWDIWIPLIRLNAKKSNGTNPVFSLLDSRTNALMDKIEHQNLPPKEKQKRKRLVRKFLTGLYNVYDDYKNDAGKDGIPGTYTSVSDPYEGRWWTDPSEPERALRVEQSADIVESMPEETPQDSLSTETAKPQKKDTAKPGRTKIGDSINPSTVVKYIVGALVFVSLIVILSLSLINLFTVAQYVICAVVLIPLMAFVLINPAAPPPPVTVPKTPVSPFQSMLNETSHIRVYN